MIKLNSHTNIESLEKAYSAMSNGEPVDLKISKNVSSIEFGIIPAIIQFISTWYRLNPVSKVILDITLSTPIETLDIKELTTLSERLLTDFYKLDFLFPSIVYAWDRDIVDNNDVNLKPLLKIQNEKMHDKMKKQTEGGGTRFMLSCFDHLSPQKGLLNSFYIDNEFIDNEMQFDFALDKSIRQVFSTHLTLSKNNLVNFRTDIIAIIYELVKNTNDWSRTDIYNKPLTPNTRGLFLKMHRQRTETYIQQFANHKGLRDYFSKEHFVSTESGELYLLEISVYDTGVGFVNRYTKKPTEEYDLAQQVDIIKQCLIVNNTSASGIQKEKKGKGLDRIMQILNRKGFIWLRTGNVSLFRNMIENTYEDNGRFSEIELYDWFKNSITEYSSLSTAQGSIVTLVYPINTANV